MRTLLLLTFLLTCTAEGFAQTAAPPRFEDLARQFDYDAKAPLDVREVGREHRGGATVVDFTYAGARGGRVPAYLVEPQDARGPSAVILYGHWMMPGSPLRNRREFLEEALVMARVGVVSLLIDAPYNRPGFVRETDETREAAQSAEVARQQVIDFRRGLDLLLARGGADPKRVAYVGHSFDAHVGAILAGVEKRIGSFVLMAGAYATEEYVFDSENKEMTEVRRRHGDAALRAHFREYAWDDPAHFVGRSSPAAVFLQYGRLDKPIPERLARRDFERFGEPKKMAFYDAGHGLDAAARRERAVWLAQRLSLRRPDLKALARIPELK